MINIFYTFRRELLKRVIPEFIWPRYIEIDKIPIKIRHTPYSFNIKRILSFKPHNYEMPERLLCRQVKEGDIVLEFGGSIGILTSILSSKVGNSGFVLSVEASEALSNYSRTWLEASGNIKVVNALAFPIYSRIPMSVSFNDDRGSLGGKVSFINSVDKTNLTTSFFIEDSELLHKLKPNVLVCDIEGSEVIMLDNKPNFPECIQKIIIELHPSIYGEKKMNEIINTIKTEGYILSETMESTYQFIRI